MDSDIKPLMLDIRTELRNISTRVMYLESAKSAHAEMLTTHASKHTQHDDQITGIHRRLVVVEEIVTKRPVKRIAKGKRK